MKLALFDYSLPEELIAKTPSKLRDHSQLLVLNKENGKLEDRHFYHVLDYLRSGDILVLNNSKVIPAKLTGHKTSGGKAEILLDHEVKLSVWEAIGKGLKVGSKIVFNNSDLEALVINKDELICTISFNMQGLDLINEIEKVGQVPLPPYIEKDRDERDKTDDKERYQTVYAKDRGSVAAPTAGLHFTKDLLDQIRAKGVRTLEVTLHVGLGTFLPVKSENITQHKMHSEFYSIEPEVLNQIIEAKKNRQRIIAVGTTSARVLESVFELPTPNSQLRTPTISAETNIFIYPGYKFKCIDAMITNFHLPKSTLLMLVSALAGRENILNAYQHAIQEKYRFYSYGDAMLII